MPTLQAVPEDEEDKEAGRRDTVIKSPPVEPEKAVNPEQKLTEEKKKLEEEKKKLKEETKQVKELDQKVDVKEADNEYDEEEDGEGEDINDLNDRLGSEEDKSPLQRPRGITVAKLADKPSEMSKSSREKLPKLKTTEEKKTEEIKV